MSDLDKRLSKLEDRYQSKNSKHTGETSQKGAGIGLKLASDFFAAVAVGALIGYWLDRFFSTKPWLMVGFLFLGFATGVYKLYRTSQAWDERQERHPDDDQR